ncbi:MAG: hypothetical protein AB7P76_08830 [Candidatus Melainabacteria bacterium]
MATIMNMPADAALNTLAQHEMQSVKKYLHHPTLQGRNIFDAETNLTELLTEIKLRESRQQDQKNKESWEAYNRAREHRMRLMDEGVIFY